MNFQKTCHLIIEEFEGIEAQPKYEPDKCEDCNTLLLQDTYFKYCDKCGTIDFDKPIYVDHEWKAPQTLYKRRLYCIDKLNMMACYKHSRSKVYVKMIKELEEWEFNCVKELKCIMKELKYHKFYKYIYNVWFELKGTRLITLTHTQIDVLSQQFVEVESKFKQSDAHTRKNMLNYNSIIYILLRKNKIKGYKHILLPHNHIIMVQILRRII